MLQIQFKTSKEMVQTTAPIDCWYSSNGFISINLYTEIFELPESWPLKKSPAVKDLEIFFQDVAKSFHSMVLPFEIGPPKHNKPPIYLGNTLITHTNFHNLTGKYVILKDSLISHRLAKIPLVWKNSYSFEPQLDFIDL